MSNTLVPGFDNSQVLAKINEFQPLISADGNYQNEILKTAFNIGLKKMETKPLWIIPNSIRHRRFTGDDKTNKRISGTSGDFIDYSLHRQFARLVNKGNDRKLRFANKYGLLKRQVVHDLIFRNPDTDKQLQIGESLLWWQEEITTMASHLKLWDLVVSKDKEIKDVVLWHRDGIVIRLEDSEVHLVRRSNMNLLTRWEKGDTRGPALYYLSMESNKRLANSLTPRIEASPEHDIYIYPDTLLSAIWLMFFLEISGNIRLVRCDICGDYFSSYDRRAQFCSAKCRMRNYRKSISTKLRRRKRARSRK